MTSNPVGVAICRVGAIWALIVGIGGVVLEVANLLTSPDTADYLSAYTIVMILVYFVLALVLWNYAEEISSTRYSTIDNAREDPVSPRELTMVGLHLLGIYILVMAVLEILQIETFYLMETHAYSDNDSMSEWAWNRTVSERVSNVVKFLLGAILVVTGKKGMR